MNEEGLRSLLTKKEGTMLEFKTAKNNVPESMWETVCSMLNRNGGDLLLGVDNDGTIVGINEDKVDIIINNIVNQSNDTNLINPTFILFPEKYLIDGKWIIYIPIPQSSQVYKHQGTFFDRSDDADIRIKNSDIHKLYNKKAGYYSENRVFPYLRLEDFSTEVFDKIRILIKNNKPSHLWLNLNNEELLRNAGFYQRDFESGIEGYTLAAALIFGKDTTIRSVVPHYSIDARVKINELEDLRFDDRIIIKTNLIDAYELLMSFVEKHLPDPFYLEGDKRISLRDKIFREIVANLIIHREYSNAVQSTFIIYRDRVETLNASTPLISGPLNLNETSHHPKNPTISDFFMQLGLVEKMGSGAYYVSKYIDHYSGRKESVQFIDGSVFKMFIPRPLAQNVISSESDTEGVQTGTEAGAKTNKHSTAKGATKGAAKGATKGATKGVNSHLIYRNRLIDLLKSAYREVSLVDRSIKVPSDRVIYKVVDLIEYMASKDEFSRNDIISFTKYSNTSIDKIIKVLITGEIINRYGGTKNRSYEVDKTLKADIKSSLND